MALTQDDIIQSALIHVGEAYDKGNPNWKLAQTRFEGIRDRLLAETRWNFAVKLAFFAKTDSTDDLPIGTTFAYSYTIPEDSIRVLGANDPNSPLQNYGISTNVVWKVIGDTLWSDTRHTDDDDDEGLYVWYVARITDVSKWDPLFTELVMAELALALSGRTANKAIVSGLQRQREMLLNKSKIVNAQENSPEVLGVTAGWVGSRSGGEGDGFFGDFGGRGGYRVNTGNSGGSSLPAGGDPFQVVARNAQGVAGWSFIGTDHLTDGSVTRAKLASGAVNLDRIDTALQDRFLPDASSATDGQGLVVNSGEWQIGTVSGGGMGGGASAFSELTGMIAGSQVPDSLIENRMVKDDQINEAKLTTSVRASLTKADAALARADAIMPVDELPAVLPDEDTMLILRDPIDGNDEGVYVVKEHTGSYYEGKVEDSIDSVIALQCSLDHNPNGSVSEIEWTINGLHIYMEFASDAFASDPPANLYLEATHTDSTGGTIGAGDELSNTDKMNSRVTLSRQAAYDRRGHYSYGQLLSGATLVFWGAVDDGYRLRFQVYTDSAFSTALVTAGGKYYDLITDNKFPRQTALNRLEQGGATDGQLLGWNNTSGAWAPKTVQAGDVTITDDLLSLSAVGDALALTSNTQADVTTGATEGPDLDSLGDLMVFEFYYDRTPADYEHYFLTMFRKDAVGADSANPEYIQWQGAGEADIAIYANDGKLTFGPYATSYAAGAMVRVYNFRGAVAPGNQVLAGTRIPTGDDGVDGDFWVAGLDNGSTLSISENVLGSWVEIGRSTTSDTNVANLQHLTRDIHSIPPVTEWEDMDDTEGDITWAVPDGNGQIVLNDTDFDNNGADITIPAQTSLTVTYMFVRLPIATDRSTVRLWDDYGNTAFQGNHWTTLDAEGVTKGTLDEDTYQYGFVGWNLDQTVAVELKLQKRETLANTRFDGELGGEALRLARQDSRFEALEHLTRDIHVNATEPEWSDAADSEGDLYQVLTADATTLTDANFNNNGSHVQIPDGQNADTNIYVRMPAASDHTLYQITFDDREPRKGHTWTSVTGPDTTTYQYWFVYKVNNFGFSNVQLEKHNTVADTTYTGDGAIPAGGTTGQALVKTSGADYAVNWGTVSGGGGADATARNAAAAAQTTADAALPKAGGTMTGKIVLDGNATANLHPATFSQLSATSRVALAALPLAGGTMTGALRLNAAPTADLHAATKKYVDDNAAGEANNLPDPPAAGPTNTKYALVVDTDGVDSWEEDLTRNFAEFATLPSVTDFNLEDIIGYDDRLYKLGTTSEDSPNLYEATVGRTNLHIGNVYWRGVAGSQSPNGFTTDGGFSANPDNAIVMVMASSDRHMRVIVKQSVFENFKGSSFASTDKLYITLALESGDTDRVLLNYYSAYERDTHYIIFQARHATDNFNLYGETAGNNMGMTFRVGSSTGNLFAHAVSLLHWLEWPSNSNASSGGEALALAQANKARLDAYDVQVDGSATPIHDITYDATTVLTAPLAGSAGDNAVETTYNDVQRGDLLVFDWTKCEHLNDHSEHVVPGSNTDAGRMYVSVDQFNNVEWDGEFIYALERALQDNGSPDTLNSWIVGNIQWNAPNLTFGLHLQQGGSRTNRSLRARAGFSLRMRVFRNADPTVATEGSIHSQLEAIHTILGDLEGIQFLTQTAYDALTPADNTLYFTRPGS